MGKGEDKKNREWKNMGEEERRAVQKTCDEAVQSLLNCGNFESAAVAGERLVEAAAAGCPDAQFYIGEMYRQGVLLPESDADAFPFYLRAAKAGQAEAMYFVAWFYYRGAGGAKMSVKKAFKWLERSSDGGCTAAQSTLAVYTRDGEYVPKSHFKAIRLFGLAAAKGDRVAQKALDAYDETVNPWREPNYEAYAPFDDGVNGLSVMDHVEKRVRRMEFLRDVSISHEEFEELSAAQYGVGHAYETGEGMEKNLEKAVEWYRKAAENCNEDGEHALANCLLSGNGVKRDEGAAFDWMIRAAYHCNREAERYLMELFDEEFKKSDIEEKRSRDSVVKWLRIAAEHGSVQAMYDLAYRYEEGMNVAKSEKEAEMWRERAKKLEAEGDPRRPSTRI